MSFYIALLEKLKKSKNGFDYLLELLWSDIYVKSSLFTAYKSWGVGFIDFCRHFLIEKVNFIIITLKLKLGNTFNFMSILIFNYFSTKLLQNDFLNKSKVNSFVYLIEQQVLNYKIFISLTFKHSSKTNFFL